MLPGEECDNRQWQLMPHAKSENELWFERQRKQIHRKRRRLHLLDSLDTGHYRASWSSTSSSPSSSDSSEDSEPLQENKTTTEQIHRDGEKKCPGRNGGHRHSRHRRNTLSTVTSSMLLPTNAKPKSTAYVSNMPQYNGISACQCAPNVPSLRDTQRRSCKSSNSSRPVWKVVKQSGSKPNIKNHCGNGSNGMPAVTRDNGHSNSGQPNGEDVGQSNKCPTIGSHLPVNSVDNSTARTQIKSDSSSQLNFAQRGSLDLAIFKDNSSPVYDLEEKPFDLKSAARDSVSHSETAKCEYPVSNPLTHSTSSSISAGAAGANILVPRTYQINRSRQTRLSNPRIHSMQGLTRAKIKTVKITLIVITCYVSFGVPHPPKCNPLDDTVLSVFFQVMCSSPFICVQLWSQYWPGAQQSTFWSGKSSSTRPLLSLAVITGAVLRARADACY